MLKNFVNLGVVVFALFLATETIAESPVVPSVSIEKGLFFISSAGEPVKFEPGTYHVTEGKAGSYWPWEITNSIYCLLGFPT